MSARKEKFTTHSVNPVFMSDAEEGDFSHYVVAGAKVAGHDIVDLDKRLRGEDGAKT